MEKDARLIPQKRRSAFTLVETLAAIAIIVSLAALLFPTIAEAKRAAKKTPCESNLHQIGIATTLYMSDNDDHYPIVVNAFERTDTELRFGRHKEDDPNLYPDPIQALAPYARDNSVYKCPMDTGVALRGLTAYPRFSTKNGGSSYLFAELFDGQSPSTWKDPANAGWACDANPEWHASDFDGFDYSSYRVVTVYYDFHVATGRHNAPVWLE